MDLSKSELTRMIDHTNVKATATKADIEKLCKEAKEHGFRCVCVNPIYVKLATHALKNSEVSVCSTIGFPFGTTLPELKALEAVKMVEEGAEELDMVMNLSALKSKDHNLVIHDIRSVSKVKRLSEEILVKVIIETAYLTDDEKVTASCLAKEAGADFVKTSTGFFGKGATIADVRLIRQTVGDNFGVKAAGGIRRYTDALSMIKAGASRIGSSTGVEIIKGAM